jgi:hypothetical protein
MKKRSPSSGQNGQLVHWWLPVHSGRTPVVIRTGFDTNVILVDGSFFFFLGSARILSSSQPSHLGSKRLLRI